MIDIVFASNNQNKHEEAKAYFSKFLSIKTLSEIGCVEDIPETKATIKENAIQKAQYIFDKYSLNCFSDDTGLEVKALNGDPGVYSARYAGESKDADKNMEKLLSELISKTDRKARFLTVIALIIDAKMVCFEGVVEGSITLKKQGNGGFGYDPIFKPLNYDCTFGEMKLQEKNKISHRARAFQKFHDYLIATQQE